MQRVLIINGHQPWPFSEGRLNAALTDVAATLLRDQGCEIHTTNMVDGYNADEDFQGYRAHLIRQFGY